MIRRTFEPFKFLGYGHLMWVPLRVAKGTPWRSLSHTWETNGERMAITYVFRLPIPWLRPALGFGMWQHVHREEIVPVRDGDIEYNAYCAVNGAVSREDWDKARRVVAAQGLDPDEEMEIMQAMGIFA